MTEEINLWMSSKVRGTLDAEKQARLEAQMVEQSAKIDEKQAQRRAKETQRLVEKQTRRALLKTAIAADAQLSQACSGVEKVKRGRVAAKVTVKLLEGRLVMADRKIVTTSAALAKATDAFNKAKLSAAALKQKILTLEADDGLIGKSQKLREAWANSQEAWDLIQKAVRKKERDRALKKRAKDLLDD